MSAIYTDLRGAALVKISSTTKKTSLAKTSALILERD